MEVGRVLLAQKWVPLGAHLVELALLGVVLVQLVVLLPPLVVKHGELLLELAIVLACLNLRWRLLLALWVSSCVLLGLCLALGVVSLLLLGRSCGTRSLPRFVVLKDIHNVNVVLISLICALDLRVMSSFSVLVARTLVRALEAWVGLVEIVSCIFPVIVLA